MAKGGKSRSGRGGQTSGQRRQRRQRRREQDREQGREPSAGKETGLEGHSPKPGAGFRRTAGWLAVLAVVAGGVFSGRTFLFPRSGSLAIVYPFDGALFPPEIIPPTVWWKSEGSDANRWRIGIEFADGLDPVRIEVDTTFWVPDPALWESIKARSLNTNAEVTVSSLVSLAGLTRTLSSQTIAIATSPDSVGAPIFFRDVPLPFIDAVENVASIKWRLGNVGSEETPRVALEGLPVCGNCHSFSADGSTLGMDVDVANDKGAYVLTRFQPETIFSTDKIFSWYDYYGGGQSVPTFGLLARVSPDGRYVVGGMKDRAVFLPRSDLEYSQLFFPVAGTLAYYDGTTRKITMLPGADDDRYVQANATWTPDGKNVTFARASVPTLTTTDREPNVALSIPESAEVLGGTEFIDESREGYKKFLFDLYTLPFNDGRGGAPVPLKGASGNGRSNYFPKYSPDGKWVVFTQAESFMLLMPDSRLYIMPAEGGEPRLMNCNTESMNSWHSWSPNGRWLVFSSKLFSPYTQLFLTHIDENGMDTPPVLLRNFIIPERAANIPEFVNIPPEAERHIEERFLTDYNYLRQGRSLERFGRVDQARSQYLESLQLNPDNTEARLALGISYANEGRFDEAEAALREIPEGDEKYNRALYCLGGVFAERGEFEEAIGHFRRSLEIGDGDSMFEAQVHSNLGRSYFSLEDYDRAVDEFQAALRLDPEDIDSFIHLGNIHIRRGEVQGAILNFERALELRPSLESLRERIAELRALGSGS